MLVIAHQNARRQQHVGLKRFVALVGDLDP